MAHLIKVSLSKSLNKVALLIIWHPFFFYFTFKYFVYTMTKLNHKNVLLNMSTELYLHFV